MARRYELISVAEQRELWRRWKQGESVRDIERALGVAPKRLGHVILRHAGIAPLPRSRAPRVLTLAEREGISRGIAAGASIRAIARLLARAPSTISREIARHGGRLGYRAARADAQAWVWAKRPKRCRLATCPRLRTVVAAQLAERWSPEQISGWLMQAYPEDPMMRVSPETLYRSLYLQARGVLKKELVAHLRRRRPARRSRHAVNTGQRRAQIVDAVSIAERPPTVADRAIPGHWEGDLIVGAHHSDIATLVERSSRFVMLVRVPSKATGPVVDALLRQVQHLPASLLLSLTWDRGLELAEHRRFTIATAAAVYFCDPQSPWQRGSNENTNGLLRQYFPKGMDLRHIDQASLDAVAWQLNTRPRKTLDFNTPAATFAAFVASTG